MASAPLLDLGTWVPILDGDPSAAAMYDRHYSAARSLARRQERGTLQFGGPSARLILMTPDRSALFGWRRQKFRADEQTGVECFIFRNEGFARASALIKAADLIADARWPADRHFTFIDPEQVGGDPPGNCFRHAGWRPCGVSQERGLLILERIQRSAVSGRQSGR